MKPALDRVWLANAVFDALKAVNVRKIEMPYTPDRILERRPSFPITGLFTLRVFHIALTRR